eukprot:CAMPEP_0197842376 /NCGR_PEP_ID=MMETSP1437-20131217/46707_1 /TAXON_ID=49252 ORGANISM="Eucampia antarctica, Strain CCMP1452" /NCGR_SAMPLE_ID=MMETSP1437 /ASSEMBLY_ACC=CAM_ASM_001096 /LENGTH=60 /DNA_ID=CAMNT_0043452247 /DNA_START=843 /DNA_END=1025 /DNA_ORIENTATION=+
MTVLALPSDCDTLMLALLLFPKTLKMSPTLTKMIPAVCGPVNVCLSTKYDNKAVHTGQLL